MTVLAIIVSRLARCKIPITRDFLVFHAPLSLLLSACCSCLESCPSLQFPRPSVLAPPTSFSYPPERSPFLLLNHRRAKHQHIDHVDPKSPSTSAHNVECGGLQYLLLARTIYVDLTRTCFVHPTDCCCVYTRRMLLGSR